MHFGGFDWDSGNLPKCLGHGVSLVEIEALFGGDVYIVSDSIIGGERRTLAFGNGRAAGFSPCSPGEATESAPSACASCMRRRSSDMSKKFPDLKSDEEADAWLQGADLTEYDLTDMKKVRFELARKDASISLRLPGALLASLRAEAAKANMPTQRLIRMLIEAQLAERTAKAKRKAPRKLARPSARAGRRAA
ncbi:MAG TPA: BrnA antitoxin family protein [Bradyrhizobium sp.]|nr:BrnA antitoxin family protein [Bradyrhizobium sp.]